MAQAPQPRTRLPDMIAVDFSRVPKREQAEEHSGKLRVVLDALWAKVQQGDEPSTTEFVKRQFLDVPDEADASVFLEFISDTDLQAVGTHAAGLLEACFTDDALARLKSSEIMNSSNTRRENAMSFRELVSAGEEIAKTFCVDAQGWTEFNRATVTGESPLPALPALSDSPGPPVSHTMAHMMSQLAFTQVQLLEGGGGLQRTVQMISQLAFAGNGVGLSTLLTCGQGIFLVTNHLDTILLFTSMVYNVNLFPSQQWAQWALMLKVVMFANNTFNKTESWQPLNTVLQTCTLVASTMSYLPWFIQMSPGTLVWRVVSGTVSMTSEIITQNFWIAVLGIVMMVGVALVYGDDELSASPPVRAIKNTLNFTPVVAADEGEPAYALALRSNRVVRRNARGQAWSDMFQSTQRYIEYGKAVKAFMDIAQGNVTMKSLSTVLRVAPNLATRALMGHESYDVVNPVAHEVFNAVVGTGVPGINYTVGWIPTPDEYAARFATAVLRQAKAALNRGSGQEQLVKKLVFSLALWAATPSLVQQVPKHLVKDLVVYTGRLVIAKNSKLNWMHVKYVSYALQAAATLLGKRTAPAMLATALAKTIDMAEAVTKTYLHMFAIAVYYTIYGPPKRTTVVLETANSKSVFPISLLHETVAVPNALLHLLSRFIYSTVHPFTIVRILWKFPFWSYPVVFMILREVTGATARLLEQQLTKALTSAMHWAMQQHKKTPTVVVSEPPPVASRPRRRADKQEPVAKPPPPSAPDQEPPSAPAEEKPAKRAASSKQRVQGKKGAGARHPHAVSKKNTQNRGAAGRAGRKDSDEESETTSEDDDDDDDDDE